MSRPVTYIQTKVDAYILNTSVVGDSFFLANVSQPSYENLLPNRFNLRHDIGESVDVQNASPWQINPRIADVVTGEVNKSKLGIYLHWCLPKTFRSGESEGGTVKYSEIPDRWLVFRHVTESQPYMSALEIFLVESNKIRKVHDLFDAKDDLERASSPFLDPELRPEEQLDTVMGMLSRLSGDWEPDKDDKDYHCPLTVMGTGDPLFADYMPHNDAVFSLHDNLTSSGKAPGSTESAKVSYTVCGFFAKDVTAQSQEPMQVCWGSLYSVNYQRDQSPGLVQAAEVADRFARLQPLAIGDNVLDACIATLEGSQDIQESAVSEVLCQLKAAAALPGSTSQLDRASTSSGSFKASHGGYHWRVKQKEKSALGGTLEPPGASNDHVLTVDQIKTLRRLNEIQDYLDALHRRKRYVRHLIFCEWWKHRSLADDDEPLAQQRRSQAVTKAQRLLKRMEMVNTLISAAEEVIATVEKKALLHGPFEKVEGRKFFSHADPAFVLRDIGSGWPANWDEKTPTISDKDLESWLSTSVSDLRKWVEHVPFDKNAGPTTTARVSEAWDVMITNKGLHKLPPSFQLSVRNMVLAFTGELMTAQPGSKSPFNSLSLKELCWDGQPWRPLFIEWEAEYVHIPVGMWHLVHDDDGSVRYDILPGNDLSKVQLSSRSVSGRSLLQPDAQTALQGMLKMMIKAVPHASGTENEEAKWMNDFLGRLSLSFGRLDGFTDHLLTLCQGGHAIPTRIKRSSRFRSTLPSDIILGDEKNLDLFYGISAAGNEDASESAGGLDVTPYGARHEGLSYVKSRKLSAQDEKNRFFRPVTHGQVRLTNFNIIDRFGQVICAFDPRPSQGKKAFYPHIASNLLCDPKKVKDDVEPNIALPLSSDEVSNGDCPWFQLGPRINQDARLHATFMATENTTTGTDRPSNFGLRPAADGDTAVFAWLLINFHNQSIQVYDEKCIFKGEAYLPSNPYSDQPVHWESLMMTDRDYHVLPHMLLNERGLQLESGLRSLVSGNTKRIKHLMSLHDLILSMSNAKFLRSLWESIVAAQDHIHTTSTEQSATFPSALVGRPIALANLGLGIELATPPMRSQAYADYAENDPLQDEPGRDDVRDEVYEFESDSELGRYEFGIKLGDMLGGGDGLIGYFTPSRHDANEIAWAFVTDYCKRDDKSSIFVQHPANAPPLTVSPNYPSLLPESTALKPSLNILTEVNDYRIRKNEALLSSAVTVLMDPFLPVNIRSGILPAVSAQLNQTVIEHDLRSFSIMIRSGPTLIGARGSDPVLSEVGRVDIQIVDGKDEALSRARFPVHTPAATTTGAKWQWVQPVEDDIMAVEGNGVEEPPKVNYVHLDTTEPLKEGFDSMVGVEGERANEDGLELAVALEGVLVSSKYFQKIVVG
ncbi:hypothetical protein DER45DRAFT_635125 [Fusarium avenaceum]|nr:hypothetical protein DER45DRAFT_635125 [Fusarium avenaceum]